MRIGTLVLDLPVVLAPMAGVTTSAFRRLCAGFGAGLYVSEMVTARALVEGNARTMRMIGFRPDEAVRSVQLYGVDPAVVGRAVDRLVDDIGVDHIDLNFGCPAPKVTKKGGGAALPVHRRLLAAVVGNAVRHAGAVPVTVKMRIGTDAEHRTAVASGRIAEDEGAAAVTLHARTAEQLYSGQADWAAIAELKQAVTTIPVLGNGDIWEGSDALAMMEATGCDGVVIGRGCLGRPWLFAELADVFAGRPPRTHPPLGVVAETIGRHGRMLVEDHGEQLAMRELRKHIGWYLTGFAVGGAARRDLALVSSLAELDDRLGALEPGLTLPPGAHRLPRGHTNGPRPVALPAGWLDDPDDPRPPAGADAFVSGG
ncbi:MAG: tRNA dihydrouridine synthase DusB [Actinomycetota bacterium]|nr:tRNA dihydrouridine synthase DusB [Actinomycetota bacterium]